MEDSLPRGALPGKALVPSVVLGLVAFVATLGGPFAVLVAAALVWLWRGRPIWLAAVLALALGLASWAMSRGDRPAPGTVAAGARTPAVVARADA
ncbi:MAG TPA: hypothetical protein VND21_11755, partial [Planctomycetota bacterium]|nr:hypothetical protein [Planctomycetota bacterium]